MKIKIGLPLVMLNINLLCAYIDLFILVREVSNGAYTSALWTAGVFLLCVFASWMSIRDINSTLTEAINDNSKR